MIERTAFDGTLVDLTAQRRLARITDHALVRWIERVEGRDIEALRRLILSSDALIHAMALKASGVTLPHQGVVAKLAGSKVISFIPEGGLK